MLTVEEVEERFEEAARTLRRLPNPPGSGPKGYGSSWPEYIHEERHAYGYHDVKIKVVPAAAEIERMEECIGWLSLVKPDDAKIIWLRAEGRRWREVGIQLGIVRQTAWRRWVAALQTVTARVNSGVKPASTGRKAPPKRKSAKKDAKNTEKDKTGNLL